MTLLLPALEAIPVSFCRDLGADELHVLLAKFVAIEKHVPSPVSSSKLKCP